MIAGSAGALALGASGLLLPRAAMAQGAPVSPGVPDGTRASAKLEALAGKKPLIKLSYRPPNYETPIDYFNEAITPNDAFFVRWHLSNIQEIELKDWKLTVDGDAAGTPAQYTLDDLKTKFPQVELVAVCQCSGNRRGLSKPHVQGVEWGYGAMGNARWRGVRLKDVLEKSGVKKEALEIAFNGADSGALEKTPDFIKSIPAWKALDENTILAYEMNGKPLPHWNGFPLRLIVAGWTGTYWMKQLVSIEARTKPLGGFWMAAAYRIPIGKFALVDRFVSQETATNTPITEIVVNSLITNVRDGHKAKAGQPLAVKGIAWDGGYGIAEVEYSVDGGRNWQSASLGQDLGRFSFRPFSFNVTPAAGSHTIMARATNRLGASQPMEAIFNPAGYHHNAIQRVQIAVA
jgi:DMSO/TMAO reductase YedYZ molybdopterin-dependent catalytic subunit